MSLRFVACVAAGRLEGETLLLFESIRRFGGAHAAAPLSAYRPRAGDRLESSTYAALERLGVDVREATLNVEHARQPLANKVYALAHAEAGCAEEVLVFCDSDAVFLAEPDALALAPEVDAAVAPVGRVGDGSTGPGHANEDYWQRLYELAEAAGRPFTETALRRRRIRAYWNTGLVALRREVGIAQGWLDLLRVLTRKPHVPDRGIDAIDQIALSAVLARAPERVATLPATYNFRITRRDKLRGRDSSLDLPGIVHVHYMRSFHVPGFLERLDPPLDRASEQYRWLRPRLPLEPRIEVDAGAGSPVGWRQIREAATGELARGPVDDEPA